MMRMTPGRPLLTITYLRSLAELQPYFNTLCLANQTDNLMLAAKQLAPNTSKIGKQTTTLTNGHSEQHQRTVSNPRGSSKDSQARHLPKSKSTPSFPVTLNSKPESGNDLKTNKQIIEEVMVRDFLEPMN